MVIKKVFSGLEAEKLMSTTTETWMQEVLEDGIQMGIQQGIQMGIQQNLLRNTEQMAQHALNTLRKRFGAIDRKIQWSIRGLTFDKLGELFEAMFDFHSVENLSAWLKEYYLKEILEEQSAWLKEYQEMIREAGGGVEIISSGKLKV